MNTNNTYYMSNAQEKEINDILDDAMKNSLFNTNKNKTSFNNYKSSTYNKINSFNSIKSKSTNTFNQNKNTLNFNSNKNNININGRTINSNSMINNDNNNFINSNSRFTYCIDSDDSDEKIVKKTKKRTKSSTRIKSRTKNDNIDYEEEYQKIRKELEKYKNQLVQERIKENMLKRQVGIKSKKEGELKNLDSKKKKLKDKSNEIMYKLERSEKLRKEQKIVLDELIEEYNMLLNVLKSSPDVEITSKLCELENEEKKMNNQSI